MAFRSTPRINCPRLIAELGVVECAFSYSDVCYAHVMGVSAIVMAAGSSFTLLGPTDTQIPAAQSRSWRCVRCAPVPAKSQASRRVVEVLMGIGLKVVAIRPDAVRQPSPEGAAFRRNRRSQRHDCTIEEMEEYEPHAVAATSSTRATTTFERRSCVLPRAIRRVRHHRLGWRQQRRRSSSPTSRSRWWIRIALVTKLRNYPGEVNFHHAGVIVINKMDIAPAEGLPQFGATSPKGEPEGDRGRSELTTGPRRSRPGSRQAGTSDRDSPA